MLRKIRIICEYEHVVRTQDGTVELFNAFQVDTHIFLCRQSTGESHLLMAGVQQELIL